MMSKLIRVGNSAALTIPKKVLLKMGLKIGDTVNATYYPELGEVVIKPLIRKKRQPMDRIARLTLNFIDRYRLALEELAK
jgi:putative addiction module antidote